MSNAQPSAQQNVKHLVGPKKEKPAPGHKLLIPAPKHHRGEGVLLVSSDGRARESFGLLIGELLSVTLLATRCRGGRKGGGGRGVSSGGRGKGRNWGRAQVGVTKEKQGLRSTTVAEGG